jgi:hypothetical protein
MVATAPFIGGVALDIARGWLPESDDAVISWRAADVLSTHGPLVGQITLERSQGHTAFDLGPLLYWLLTVPVHLDPVHGALWGAALWCTIAAGVTVSIGRAIGGPVGALAAAAIFPVLALALPEMPLDPAWNPSIGLCWYVAMAACAVAVGSGQRRWLPALVAAGSVAAQCHLSFAVAVPGVVAVALGLGLATTPAGARRSWRGPAVVATGVAVACWTPTVIQQLTGRPGNLTAILQGTVGHHVIGWMTAVRTLGSAVGPHPLWWSRLAAIPPHSLTGAIFRGDVGAALVVTALLLAVASVALHFSYTPLGAAAAVAFALDAGVVVSVARFPNRDLVALYYVLRAADGAGIISWLVLAWGGAIGCRTVLRWGWIRWKRQAADGQASNGRRRRIVTASLLVGAALAAIVPVPMALTAEREDPTPAFVGRVAVQVRSIDAAVRPMLGRRPVLITIASDPSLPTGPFASMSLTLGVAWLAHTQGYDVRVPAFDAAGIGPQAGPLAGIGHVRVTFPHGRPVATLVPGQPAPAPRSG